MLPPILCYVTDRNSLAAPAGPARHTALIERIAGAAAAGVDWIQVREKDLEARQLFDLASTATAAMRGSAAKLLVNDRLDVAWATGAAGVHLGENSLPIADVVQERRRSGPENFLVGASCHSPDAAVRAAHEGANYVFFGPVFATPSKAAFGEPQGWRGLLRSAGAFRSQCWPSAASRRRTRPGAWRRALRESRAFACFKRRRT